MADSCILGLEVLCRRFTLSHSQPSPVQTFEAAASRAVTGEPECTGRPVTAMKRPCLWEEAPYLATTLRIHLASQEEVVCKLLPAASDCYLNDPSCYGISRALTPKPSLKLPNKAIIPASVSDEAALPRDSPPTVGVYLHEQLRELSLRRLHPPARAQRVDKLFDVEVTARVGIGFLQTSRTS